MSTAPPSPSPALAIRRTLTALARERNDDVQRLFVRYAIERLLYRLSKSKHRNTFILKGAMLFSLWADVPYRATGDLDLLASGDPSPEEIASIFRAIVAQPVDDDGIVFLPETIEVKAVRQQADYAGCDVRMTAMFGRARLRVLVDLGFGDAVTPAAKEVDYPSLVDAPKPRLRAYPPETVIAEKFQALVDLGMANSRVKDFFDIWAIADAFSFDGATLAKAIGATFTRRKTALPSETPIALTEAFYDDAEKLRLWRAFLRRAGVAVAPESLETVVAQLDRFLTPPTVAMAEGRPFEQSWKPGGPWGDG